MDGKLMDGKLVDGKFIGTCPWCLSPRESFSASK
jgi:hypothetical protein